MKQQNPITSSCAFWGMLLYAVILLYPMSSNVASALGNETDRLSLLKFKDSISSDDGRVLSSWNDSVHFCYWAGIACGKRHQRVIALNLEGYKLQGTISPHIGNLSFMRSIQLRNNSFSGEIPQQVGRLFRLQHLSLSHNRLEGKIPVNLSYCSRLRFLGLAVNKLIGVIPLELGSLLKLEILNLHENNLTGTIPPPLGNISSLSRFCIMDNNIVGNIPYEFGRLKSLLSLSVTANNLSGTIPLSLYNISSLRVFSLSGNHFRGTLPHNMGLSLCNIQLIYFGANELSGKIPESLSNASQLQRIDVSFNNFVGQVPKIWGNLPDLSLINLLGNNLGNHSSNSLDFITSLTNCSQMEFLDIGANNFAGVLPNSIANLSSRLTQLYLGNNQINGNIPAALGNLVNLIVLAMRTNLFTGLIPNSLAKLANLQGLYLESNKLSGSFPSCIRNFTLISDLHLAGNMLEGTIPPSITYCQRLQYLDLSENNLSGDIPKEVFGLPSLLLLNLSRNSLTGSLPMEVGKLKAISIIELFENKLTGEIPKSIGACESLEILNLQGNSLQGILPPALASLRGLEHLDLSRNNLTGHIPPELQKLIFMLYLNLSFNDLEGEVPECNALRNIRHRNLVKILTCCSSQDYSGNEFKALVFEFMSNGSLEEWLHPDIDGVNQSRDLSLIQRLDIAIDVASAISYLHDHCDQPIVHCDLKPSNVLLDENMIAHVSDFGLARLIPTTTGFSGSQTSTIGIKGTIGYVAPEYAMGGEPSSCGDVYSYGILILEMFTGTRPTNKMFKDDFNLHNFVKMALPYRLVQVVDSALLSREVDETHLVRKNSNLTSTHLNKCLVAILEIGLTCSEESPNERMSMGEVTKALQLIKNAYLGIGIHGQQRQRIG